MDKKRFLVLTAVCLSALLLFVGCHKPTEEAGAVNLNSNTVKSTVVADNASVVQKIQPLPTKKVALRKAGPAFTGSKTGHQKAKKMTTDSSGSELPPVKRTTTPSSGLSTPLRDLPDEAPQMLIHPELGLDEGSVARRVEMNNPYPDVGPIQNGADALPTPVVIDDTKAAPVPGTPAVAFYDCDASTCGQPPDTDMAVSDAYIVTDYNSVIRVYNKSGVLQNSKSIQSLFNSAGMTTCGAAETSSSWLSDPQCQYDEEGDRFVLTMLRITGSGSGSYLCAAASQSNDPTGSWYGYEYNYGATTLADYPHLGIGEDAIFIGTNDFPGGSYTNSSVTAVYPKSNLYSGGSVTWANSAMNHNGYTPQPVERHGYPGQWPPSGTDYYIMAREGSTTGAGQVWKWTYPTSSGSLSWVSEPGIAYQGANVNPSGSTYTNQPIDAIDFRIFDAEMRWPYVWIASCGASGGYDFIQWYQLNVSGTPSVVDNGNYGVTSNHLWMPDLTTDKDNSLAVGFTYVKDSGASGPTYVSAYIAGRQSGDPAGTLLGPVQSVDGDVKYTGYLQNSSYRWGDYLGMAIDPNGCDIWFNGMLSKSQASSYKTQTYVKKFKFASCVPGATILATLDKSHYFCVDTVTGSITDTGGTPTNAQYHSDTGGAVAATISGGPNNFTVESKTITELGAADGDNIWLTFDGSDSSSHSSNNSSLDCTIQVCVYQVDTLTGGCDNDKYHDVGEVLNYNVAIANNESYDLPGPFEATLTTTDPDVTWVNQTATFPALGTMTYAYGDYPFALKYNGAFPANCIKTLNFTVSNIHAVDNAWSSGGCAAGSEDFTEIANADFTATGSVWSESFDGSTFPPTGWASDDNLQGAGLQWARSTDTVHPSGGGTHSGAGLAYANTWDPQPPAQCRLRRSSGSDLSSYSGAIVDYWFYHDNVYTNEDTIQVQVSTDGGSNWTDVGDPVYRYDGSANVWTEHQIDASDYTGAGMTNVMFGFLADGQYGNDEHIDDVALNVGTASCETTVCSPAPILTYDHFGFDDVDCNNDGVLDPGETGVLSLYLANGGNDWAYGTTATLTCPTCPAGVTICDGSATYGDIPYGTSYVYAAPTDTFSVAIDPSVPCNTTLPFVLTVNATNPYGPVVLNADVLVGADTVLNSYEEHFQIEPEATGGTGRVGFTSAWTTSRNNRVNSAAGTDGCADADGDGLLCEINGNRNLYHTFSSVLSGTSATNVTIYWDWNTLTSSAFTTLTWTVAYNDGTNGWRDLASSTGSTSGGWECWGGSLYYTVQSAYPGDEGLVLDNPNLQLRWTASGTESLKDMDFVQVDVYGVGCSSTTCTGTCPSSSPPPVPNNDDIAGTAFKVAPNGSNVDFTWDASSCTASDYMVLWGNVSSLSLAGGVTNGTVTSGDCGLGNTGSASNKTSPSPAAGECYFCVIDAVEGASFGRHGNNSNSNERVLSGDTTQCAGVTTKDTTATTCGAKVASSDTISLIPAVVPNSKSNIKNQVLHNGCGSSGKPSINRSKKAGAKRRMIKEK